MTFRVLHVVLSVDLILSIYPDTNSFTNSRLFINESIVP
jgi:hypothetical protein